MLDQEGQGQDTACRPTRSTKHRAVEQMTWAPGMGAVVKDRLIAEGGWFDRKDCNVFNLYKPPIPLLPRGPGRGADHLAGPCAPDLSRRRRAYHRVAGAAGAAAGGKDQPRARARRQPRDRQGHDFGAGQAGGGPVEFHGDVADQGDGEFQPHLKAVVLRIRRRAISASSIASNFTITRRSSSRRRPMSWGSTRRTCASTPS